MTIIVYVVGIMMFMDDYPMKSGMDETDCALKILKVGLFGAYVYNISIAAVASKILSQH